jgi:beta-lactamase class A
MGKLNKKNNPQKGSGLVKNKKSFLLKPIPLYLFLLFFVGLFIVFCVAIKSKKKSQNAQQEITSLTSSVESVIVRENDSGLVKPILFVEGAEDPSLNPLKIQIDNFLESEKQKGVLISASVYIKRLSSVNDMEINKEELYDPASLMKVPMLLLYLSKAEKNPQLLNQSILFSKAQSSMYRPTIKNKTLIEGKSYTIRDLLNYMIVYSDNEAFWLLGKNVPFADFQKMCSDFDIPIKSDNIYRSDNAPNFIANANSISRFFRVLYNKTYLKKEYSQFALSLLCRSQYRDGLLKGIDKNVRVAHKFGEREEGDAVQLHEFGIVYLGADPYLIGVMTKGKSIAELSNIIGTISKISFDWMKNN